MSSEYNSTISRQGNYIAFNAQNYINHIKTQPCSLEIRQVYSFVNLHQPIIKYLQFFDSVKLNNCVCSSRCNHFLYLCVLLRERLCTFKSYTIVIQNHLNFHSFKNCALFYFIRPNRFFNLVTIILNIKFQRSKIYSY